MGVHLRLAGLLLLLGIALATATPAAADTGADAYRVLDLANQERAAAGMSPLNWNDALASTATSYAQDMAARDYFSHYSPEGSSPFDRASAGGYPSYDWGIFIGENLARGFSSSDAAMQGWMASDDHRANLLRPEFVDSGVGVAVGPDGGLVLCQLFGRSPAAGG